MKHVEDLLKSLFVMASMVESRDPYTGGHLWRVSQYAWLLADHAGLNRSEVARISVGGFLHDLGKISIPDHILGKAGPLSDEEFAVIKTHPEVGRRLLSGHPLADMVKSAILSHHETPAGTGYPHNLVAEEIPIDARIVGICDAFDAMTSNRPYRRGMPVARALAIIEENLGQQFDTALGQMFIAMGRQKKLDHIVGHSEEGIPVQTCPICGPTIVITRKHNSGDHLYCRNCGNEAKIAQIDHGIKLQFTGKQGAPADLEPNLDIDLIADLVHSASQVLDSSASGAT